MPNAATIVCARVVARTLTSTPVEPNLDTYSRASAMGPFNHTDIRHVAQDVLGGGVWLTRQDKMALSSVGGTYSKMTNLPLYPFDPCPPAPPNWWRMTPASGG